MRAGAIPVPLNIKLPAESLAFIAKDANLSLLFVDAAHRKVAPDVPTVDFDADYADFLKPGPFATVEPAPDDICLQPYTSGSTGRPKGVLLTHAGQAWQIDALVKARRMTPDDRVLVAAPLYHKNALVWTKVGMAAGASLVLLARFDQRLYVESIGRYKVTRLSGVPTMFHLILNDPALARTDVSSVRFVGVGSAPASPALFEALHRAFPNAAATNGYGVTEAGPVMFANHPDGLPSARYVDRLPAGRLRDPPRPRARRGRAAHAQPGRDGGLPQPAGGDGAAPEGRLVRHQRRLPARRRRLLLLRRPHRRHVRLRRRERLPGRRGRHAGASPRRAAGRGAPGGSRAEGPGAGGLRGRAARLRPHRAGA